MVECVAEANGGEGIEATRSCVIRACVALENVHGVRAGFRSAIQDCSSSLNDGHGIVVGDQSTVLGCTVGDNGQSGILISGGTVQACSATRNGRDGIEITGSTHVRGNHAALNELAGIRVNGSGSRLEDNQSFLNEGSGFDVRGDSHFVVRNTASGNSLDFELANTSSNVYGAVRTSTAQAGPWDNLAKN